MSCAKQKIHGAILASRISNFLNSLEPLPSGKRLELFTLVDSAKGPFASGMTTKNIEAILGTQLSAQQYELLYQVFAEDVKGERKMTANVALKAKKVTEEIELDIDGLECAAYTTIDGALEKVVLQVTNCKHYGINIHRELNTTPPAKQLLTLHRAIGVLLDRLGKTE